MIVDHRPVTDDAAAVRGRVLVDLRIATQVYYTAVGVLNHAKAMARMFPSVLHVAAEGEALRRENAAWDAMALISVGAGLCVWPGCELDCPTTSLCDRHAADVAAQREEITR
ncbi:MAG: hypothetical protein ACRD0W_00925 [Acidimicrobiales bacterium]